MAIGPSAVGGVSASSGRECGQVVRPSARPSAGAPCFPDAHRSGLGSGLCSVHYEATNVNFTRGPCARGEKHNSVTKPSGGRRAARAIPERNSPAAFSFTPFFACVSVVAPRRARLNLTNFLILLGGLRKARMAAVQRGAQGRRSP